MYWHHDDRLLAQCIDMTKDCLLNVLTWRQTSCWMYWHNDDRPLAECTDMTTDLLLNVLTLWQQTTCWMYWHHDRLLIMGSFIQIYVKSHYLKNNGYQQGTLQCQCGMFHMNSSYFGVFFKINKAYASHTYVVPLNSCGEEVAAPSRRLAAPCAAVCSCSLYTDRSSKQQCSHRTPLCSAHRPRNETVTATVLFDTTRFPTDRS